MMVRIGQLHPATARPGAAAWDGVPATATPATTAVQAATADPAASKVAAVRREADQASVIGASPPPEVQAEVAQAAERAAKMAADDRELHFSKDPSSGRIVVEVRDLEGNVLRVIPPSEALEIMSGSRGVG